MRHVLVAALLAAGCSSSDGRPAAAIRSDLSGFAKDQPGSASGREVRFACDSGETLTVLFRGNTARLTSLPDQPETTMQPLPAASGFWYEGGAHALRGKGDQLTWTTGRTRPRTCRVDGS